MTDPRIRTKKPSLGARLRETVAVGGTLVFAGCCCDGCCRCCEGSPTPAAFRSAPEALVASMVIADLGTNAVLASTMCGVRAKGLSHVELEKQTEAVSLPWGGRFHVKGLALPADGTTLAKPVECTGVVSWTVHADSSGCSTVTGWEVKSLELYEVETPGVSWSRPSTGDDDWD